MCDCQIEWLTNKDNVNEIVINEDVETIGANCFSQFTSLTTITIGENVRAIGQSSFYNTKITTIAFPSSVVKKSANVSFLSKGENHCPSK